MKILLVNPPYRRLMGTGHAYFPLGLGYIAAVLEKAGHQVKIYNGEVPKKGETGPSYKGGDFKYIMSAHEQYLNNLKDENFFVWNQFKKTLDDFKPEIVGVLVRSPLFNSALIINKLVKEWNKDCRIVWGGPHPTVAPLEVISMPEVDYIIYGEGEYTMLELVNSIEKNSDLSRVKGIYYKDISGRIVKNSQREYIQNLQKLPLPARHLVFDDDVYAPGAYADLMGSRGCPYMCSYCSAHSTWGRKIRYRPAQDIIKEMKLMRDNYNCEIVRLLDDTLTVNRKWAEYLCNALIEENLDVKWGCLTRINLIDDKLLKLMVKAGCYRIDVGIESGSPRILKMMKKGITLEDVLKGAKLLDKYGIDWTAFFMTGLPLETKEDIEATAKFMKKVNPYRLVLSSFTPYPGTEEYERAKEAGVLPQNIDWGLYDHNSPHNFFMRHVTRDEYKKFFDNLSAWVSLRNTHRIRGKEIYYLKHPVDFARKMIKFGKKRIQNYSKKHR